MEGENLGKKYTLRTKCYYGELRTMAIGDSRLRTMAADDGRLRTMAIGDDDGWLCTKCNN